MSAFLSRRAALAGGLAGVGLLTLAACGSNSGGTAATRAPAGGNPPAGSDPAVSGPGGSATGGSATGGLAALDSITVGEAVAAKLDGRPVLVSRPTRTTAACFSAICTHEGCTVAPAGKELQCPCHGSVYNATTGAVISGPAPRALDKIPVQIDNGEVVPVG